MDSSGFWEEIGNLIHTTITTTLRGYLYNYNIEWLEFDDLEIMTGDALKMWRPNLKERLDWIFGNLRPRTCLVCGKSFGTFDMHEGILSRQDVRGWKGSKKMLIMSEINCVPLHHKCHMDRPPSREDAWHYQVGFYGWEVLNRWYFGLPFKIGPPRFF